MDHNQPRPTIPHECYDRFIRARAQYTQRLEAALCVVVSVAGGVGLYLFHAVAHLTGWCPF